MVHQGIEELQACLDPLDLLDLEEHRALKENEEMLVPRARKDHQVLLDSKDPLDPWDREESEERKDHLERLDLLDLVEGLETRDLLVMLV